MLSFQYEDKIITVPKDTVKKYETVATLISFNVSVNNDIYKIDEELMKSADPNRTNNIIDVLDENTPIKFKNEEDFNLIENFDIIRENEFDFIGLITWKDIGTLINIEFLFINNC